MRVIFVMYQALSLPATLIMVKPLKQYYITIVVSGVARGGPGGHDPPVPESMRMVGNGGPITGCLFHSHNVQRV